MQNSTRLAYNINGVNRLPPDEKTSIYARLIPQPMLSRYNLSPPFIHETGAHLLQLRCPSGSSDLELKLFHHPDDQDALLYGHLTDTLNGQVHVLLYIMNDLDSPRFDVDRMPDGTPTRFGTDQRNLAAEQAALQFGLAPGQIRRGLRMLSAAIQAFEQFVESLGASMYFADPLYYHNAILFERHGFAYEKGRRLMESIQQGFSDGGTFLPKLNGSSPFRQPAAANSIRLRSWAIHDGLLGTPFTNVTMYKHVGKSFNLDTSHGCPW